MMRLIKNFGLACALGCTCSALSTHAQLAITEVMSSASTNSGGSVVVQGPDFWELTNFGTNSIDLTGYVFNDADATRGGDADAFTLSGVVIGPGESILLVQSGTTGVQTREDFINWWGSDKLPASVQVLFYSGNGMSSGGDSIVLWAPDAVSDADWLDRADIGEAVRGHSFTYDTSTGAFGLVSSNGLNGAFTASTSDDEGSPGTTAGSATLTITQQPAPGSLTVPASDNAAFTVAATGLPRPRFQWFFGTTPIEGAIRASLTLTNVQLTNAGAYHVVITNGLQTVTSASATLNVTTLPSAPEFTAVPKDIDAFNGQTVRFTGLASGSPSPAYQWMTNGVPLPGETGPALTLYGIAAEAAATYTFVASNSAGTNAVSAVLTVGPRPKLLITELHSTGSSSPGGHEDWWELTSFEAHPINLKGYRWDDSGHSLAPNNAFTFTNDLLIHPGESVIFVEKMTPAKFREWWGANLPEGLQIVTYAGGGLGLSSTSDEVNLWNAATLPGNELTERIAAVNFGSSPLGVSFVYDPENPPIAGVFGVLANSTVKGASANGIFTAAVSGDLGSPGYVVAPIRVQASIDGSGQPALQWNTVVDRQYELLRAETLPAPSWTSLLTTNATEATTGMVDSEVSANHFYRVAGAVPYVEEQP